MSHGMLSHLKWRRSFISPRPYRRLHSTRFFSSSHVSSFWSIDNHQSSSNEFKEVNLFNEIEEGTEDLKQYCVGGLPVIQVGDTLKRGQYKIVHKLGHGATSTIWLALCNITNELVTIKALAVAASSQSCEATFLSRFSNHRGIRHLLNEFDEPGPNGQHKYLVLEPALCSVFTAKEASYFRPLPLPIARTIIADLILTVQHLHSNGVVHGDVHTGNILLRLPDDMRRMSVSDLYSKTGEPVTEIITRKDGAPLPPNVPAEVAWPARLEVETTDISSSGHLPVMLSDFGSSFRPSLTKRNYARTRPTLTPPESFFAEEGSATISFPADIWTLACTIVEIMGSGDPFDTWADMDAIISEHVMVLGKLPNSWWKRWCSRRHYFDDDATVYLPENRPSDDSIEKRYEYCVTGPRSRHGEEVPGREEGRAFVRMLSTMLVLDPAERATIDHVAQCEWMQRWANPEGQRIWILNR